ncbi:non-ribosomal peptide synthetase [Caldalkalibacillus salinus]|uniref:non-ribosomal peptide synthetase n=1 Tax=Caldalkalibacillus salinus TaxID=2803787 RepID=UPI00192125A1|nr:non-ribosomal peptide synthetase [Caldalkalibacillus salinus]
METKPTMRSKEALSDARKKLLEHRLRLSRQKQATPAQASIPHLGVRKANLSHMQKRIWLHEQVQGPSTAYHLQSAVKIKGALDVTAFTESLSHMMERHTILRTAIKKENGEPMQFVDEGAELTLYQCALQDTPQAEQEEQVKQLIEKDAKTPFSLDRAPLFRAALISLDPEEHVFVLTMHHIISDGWSMGIFVQDLMRYYNAKQTDTDPELRTLSIDFTDYCQWEKERRLDEDSLAFWKSYLYQTPVLQLPTDDPRPLQPTTNGQRVHFQLPQTLTQDLKRLSTNHNVTLFNLLLSVFHLLLYKYTAQKDMAIGTPVANRQHPQTRDIMGCFINTVVLRNELDPQTHVIDWIKQVQHSTLQAFKHQDVPFEQVLETVQVQGDQGDSRGDDALFQVMFAFQNTPQPKLDFHNLEVASIELEVFASMFDVTLSMEEVGNQLTGFIEFNTDLYRETRIHHMVKHFQQSLRSVCIDPQQTIGEISILTEEERKSFVPTAEPIDNHVSFIELFERQVEMAPHHQALIFGEESITYAELNQYANQLAQALVAKGLPVETFVGVHFHRSIDAFISILAILKAGCAYVPLDPTYPEERLAYMLEDSGLQLVLTTPQLAHNIMAMKPELTCIEVDYRLLNQGMGNDVEPSTSMESMETAASRETAVTNLNDATQQNVNRIRDLRQLAYLIYTSGSTGKPKGVMVEHKGLYNVAQQQKSLFDVTDSSRILQFSSLNFDASVFEMVMALGNGGALYLEDKHHLLGESLIHYMAEQEITHVTLPPSVLSTLPQATLPALQVIITAGERCTEDIVNKWAVGRKFFNAYGPTEATIWATIAECEPQQPVTIGKAIEHVQLYVLDQVGQPVPKGVDGELYIGGISVARGYLNQQALTDARFIPNPFSTDPDDRLYQTGDKVRYTMDGQLAFLGRIDQQVKVRGHRIELSEIESELHKYPTVIDGVVTVLYADEQPTLAAFVVTEDEQLEALLRTHLLSSLPEYMVPTVIRTMPSFPLTPNGKIDLKKLIKEAENEAIPVQSSETLKPPVTPIQKELAEVFESLLKRQQVGIDQDFFKLGGHSLLATQLTSRIEDLYGVNIEVKTVFEHTTIEALERLILDAESNLGRATHSDNPDGNHARDPLKITPVPRESMMPLSFSQQRLWFIEQMHVGQSAYNIPACVRLKGRLNKAALKKSLQQMVARHEVFKTGFATGEGGHQGQPYQFIHHDTCLRVDDIVLHHLEKAERERTLQHIIQLEAEKPFDLTTPPLIRATLIQLDQNEHVLCFVMHHIISDGWSVDIFVKELGQLYTLQSEQKEEQHEQAIDNAIDNQETTPLQYLDYVYWQRQFEAAGGLEPQLAYWKKQLAGDIPAIQLPTDYKRPTVQTNKGAKTRLQLDPALASRIQTLNQEQGTTLFMTLLTAFNVLLHRLTGQDDFAVGTPIAGRRHTETENMIGFFINTLVLRQRMSDMADLSLETLLQNVKQTCLDAYQHQDVPFERLVEVLQPHRSLSHHPFVQVLLNVQNQEQTFVELSGLQMEQIPLEEAQSKFDLTLYANEKEGRIDLDLVYNSDLFKGERMTIFLRQLQSILEAMTADIHQTMDQITLQTDGDVQGRLRKSDQHQSIVLDKLLYKHDELLHEKVGRLAKRYPLEIAIRDHTKHWTYQEIDQKSNQVAHYLLQQGVQKGEIVTIYAKRNAPLIYSILGILKAGAAFCILDPEEPLERMRQAIKKVNPVGVIVLAQGPEEKLQTLSHEGQFTLELFDRRESSLATYPTDDPSAITSITANSDDLAYIAFTSGTTGQPNAVKGTHAPVVHFIHWHIGEHQLSKNDRFSMLSGLGHDPLLRDIFTPLSLGATLCIPEDEVLKTPETCVGWLHEQQVSVIHTTPSRLMMITEIPQPQDCLSHIRYVFFGGEALTQSHVDRVKTISDTAQVVNFYGATETPQAMSVYYVNGGREEPYRKPIGTGIEGVDIRIKTSAGAEAGLGEVGEIVIESSFLSNGYLNSIAPDNTPFSPSMSSGAKVYATGDLGRYRLDGHIELVSRKDRQIKIRGYRIEPEEIASALTIHEQIQDAYVCLATAQSKQKVLVAYYVSRNGKEISQQALQKHLSPYLPTYMMPQTYVRIRHIPVTRNGKVAESSLPLPTLTTSSQRVAATNDHEKVLLNIWREVVESEEIGVTDNFFDVGGHSLLLVQVRNRMQQELNVTVTMVDMFRYPTIQSMARHLGAQQDTDHEIREVTRTREKRKRSTLSRKRKQVREGRR